MSDVVTLRLARKAQQHFDSLRERYFPPERNLIAAHVTLFHALPEEPWVAAALDDAARQTRPFDLAVTGLQFLGRGVAYRLSAAALLSLHRRLATIFAASLIPQDRQRFDPHVVVQNKVSPAAARHLLAELQAAFAPWSVPAEGIDLWHYRGGPWEHVQTFPFAA